MFKNPFSFNGRIRRTEYGLSMIIFAIPLVILNILAATDASGVFAIVSLLFLIPLQWFAFAQGAKRCHDRNNSGWFQLIPFYSFWMLFAAGDKGDNEFGPDPKGMGIVKKYA